MKLAMHGFLTVLFLTSGGLAVAESRDYLTWAGVHEAHKITRGAGVKIAILNTGVNYQLPEFRNRIAMDANGNYGYDAISKKHDPMDMMEYGLGTQVSSITAGNEFGIAPEATMVPVRVYSEHGAGTQEGIALGVAYALTRGVDIIEIGGGPFLSQNSKPLCTALQKAESLGVLLIFSAGNGGMEEKEFHRGCELRHALVVAALDSQGDLATYSNFGFPAVHIAAPAQNIWRISRDGLVQKSGQGTSYSAAFAAGVAALVKAAHPQYSAAELKIAMVRGAVIKNSLRGKVLSNGYLNAAAAIAADIARPQ